MDQRKALKILLIEKDLVITDIARDLGISAGHVFNVLYGRFPSRPIIEAVAARLGMDPDEFDRMYIPKFKRVAA